MDMQGQYWRGSEGLIGWQEGGTQAHPTPRTPYSPAGFSVRGQLVGSEAGSPRQHQGTYFGRLGIANPATGFQLEVTPQNITLSPGPMFSWRDQAMLHQDG